MSIDALIDAYDTRVEQIGSGRKPKGIQVIENKPEPGTTNRLVAEVDQYGNHSNVANGDMRVRINPNADRSYLAHELGHAASQHTDMGQLIHQLRHNPKLKKALLGAAALLPGAAAVLTPGEDDLAGSVGLATAMYAPTLIDEALADKNALAILENAQMRANPMQRVRMAGGMLSYLGTPLVIGALGNSGGNMLETFSS